MSLSSGAFSSANASLTLKPPDAGCSAPCQVSPAAMSGSGVKSLCSRRFSPPTAKPTGPPGSLNSAPKSPEMEPETTCWVTFEWLTLFSVTKSTAAGSDE